MTLVYKLTTKDGRTHQDTQWAEGTEHRAPGDGELCGPGWLHAYTDDMLAILLNPIDANIAEPVLWEADGDIGKTNLGLKVGCTRLKTIRRVVLPEITISQKVAFGILAVLEVFHEELFVTWAHGWLDGSDRTRRAASYAALAVSLAGNTNAASYASYAVLAASYAANAAALAGNTNVAPLAADTNTASYATYVTYATFYAALAVTYATNSVIGSIDLASLARQAVNPAVGVMERHD